MASGHLGKLENFDINEGNWVEWSEQMTQFFVANDIANDKKRAILLSSCGSKCYSLFRSLVSPQSPAEKTYEELIEIMKEHKAPRPSVIMERFKFNKRDRKEGESIATYVACLRKMTEFCEFGTTLNEMLRDRLVVGVNDERIQQRLLSEKELTWEAAISKARSMEAAASNMRDMQSNKGERVYWVEKKVEKREISVSCYGCGGKHKTKDCRSRDVECFCCHRKGHYANRCPQKKKEFEERKNQNKSNTHSLQVDVGEVEEIEESLNHLFKISEEKSKAIVIEVNLNNVPVIMEVDTGACLTVINQNTWERIKKSSLVSDLVETDLVFRTYTKEVVKPLGKAHVEFEYEGQVTKLPVFVVTGSKPNLFGRNWLEKIRLNWKQIFAIQILSVGDRNQRVESLLGKYKGLFENSLGTMKDVEANIDLKGEANPKFCKARPIPYALRDRVDKELDRLVGLGILEPVKVSKWAAPIVPIVKSDNSIRLCGDYKVTINQAALLDNYPIPKGDDLFTQMTGGERFSKLDLSQAYTQMVLNPDSRLPYGVNSAPGIFQREMEKILNGVPYTVVRIDDILVSGKNDEEHLENLGRVLQTLENAGLKLKREKCQFLLDEVI